MKTTVKILIAEHDADDLELIRHELTARGMDYTSKVVQTEREYIHLLKTFIPDIILCDYSFPSFSGLEAFKIRQRMAPGTPFIFVSGTIGEEKSIELIKTGVTDYALKDKLFTLNFKVVRALKESKQQQQKLKADAALALSEKWLARAQQLAQMGNWVLNFPGDRVRLSEEACRIYGIKPGLNRPQLETWLSFIHPEDLDTVRTKIGEAGESLLGFSITCRIINQNGFARNIYLEGRPEFDLTGKPTGLYGIVHDVTEMVLLENKLASERAARQREITAAVLEAQENERAVITTELYDNLNQILGATKLYVELAKTDEENRQVLLEKSTGFIVQVIESMIKISKTLSGPGIHAGLFNCIKMLIADLIAGYPIDIQFFGGDVLEEQLHENLQLAIFRIVQEQVANIIKHSGATRASIDLSREEDDEVVLTITDNGEGNNALKKITGVGIKNIRSRAELYNGKVTIISQPGKGYALKVVLSLKEHANKNIIEKPVSAP